MGLNLTTAPLEYNVKMIVSGWGADYQTFTLDLLDIEHRVGIIVHDDFSPWLVDSIIQEFAEHHDIIVGAIGNWWHRTWSHHDDFEERRESAREALHDDLITQVQTFIEKIQADGRI